MNSSGASFWFCSFSVANSRLQTDLKKKKIINDFTKQEGSLKCCNSWCSMWQSRVWSEQHFQENISQYRKSNIPQINLIFSSCPVLPIRALYWVLHMIFFFPWSSWHKRDKEYISYPLLCYVIYYCHSSRTHNTSIFVKCSYPHFFFSYQSNLAEHLQAISIPLK